MRPFLYEPFKGFFLAGHADTARYALTAGFLAEEFRDAQQNAFQIDRFVKRQDHAGTERGANRPHAFKSERRVQFVRRDKGARRAAEQNCLQSPIASDSAGEFDNLSKCRAERDLVHAWPRNVSRKTKEPRPRGLFRADAGERCAAFENDPRNIDQRFNVIDDGWLVEQSGLRGERRFVARLAAIALDRVEERCFFAADVRPRTSTKLHIE